jgi:hypothetical protein
MSLEFDMRQFRAAVRFVVDEVKARDLPETLNRAGANIVYRAPHNVIKNTPKADVAKIRGLSNEQHSRDRGHAFPEEGHKAHGEAIQGRHALRKETSEFCQSDTRKGPGWHKAAVAMGGKGVRVQKGFQKAEARRGTGKKASAARLITEIVNTAPAAAKIGQKALQDAINAEARDMVAYGERKLQKTFRKVNA